jgi:hypothetical protein
MARKKRSERELAAAADRLHAEVRRFTLLVNTLVAPPRPLPPVAVEAVHAAFLDLAAALSHFLHPVRPKAGDVLAADFFPTAARWNGLRLPQSDQLKGLRDGARSARITYGAAPPEPDFDPRRVLEIANEISAGVSIFLRHAPAKALGERWRGVRRDD